jgi:hypothetical protein
MEENAHLAPFTQDHPKPGEKLAAHLMGRWKNGLLQPVCLRFWALIY